MKQKCGETELDQKYFHSVRLNSKLCKGCVNCIKYCPTEAIRIRNGKATIIQERCIDCGECIRRCPSHAKVSISDNLSDLSKYSYNIALPPPSFLGQFSNNISIEKIFAGLKQIGFDYVYEMALASDFLALELETYVKEYSGVRKPLISFSCPAIVRLIQLKFPELIKQIVPMVSPLQIAAAQAQKIAIQKTGLMPKDIGIWYLSPCPAKSTGIHQEITGENSSLSGSISTSKVYAELRKIISTVDESKEPPIKATSFGLCWGIAGGEVRACGVNNALIVDGVENAVDVMEQISINKMQDVDYVECLACPGGCIGGPLVAENRFVAEKNIKLRIRQKRDNEQGLSRRVLQSAAVADIEGAITAYSAKKIEATPMMKLDENIIVAMKKLEAIEKTLGELPGLDCGSCGSPSCQSLAEDIVQGTASETDCVFKLRVRVDHLADEMKEMSKKITTNKEDKA